MSYEPPVLSRKLGFGNGKAPESSSRFIQPRLVQGEKPANGLTRSLPQLQDDNVQRQNFKLLIDPAIKKGHSKIYRYNGVFPGQPPVVPKDPRSRRTRLWTLNKADLPVPNFKVDKWYVGIPPQREVHFSGLNDNVDKKFLEEMCERYGKIDVIKIYFDPQTKKHTGKGRVTFATTAAAKMAVSKLDHTSVMGNIIKAHIEANTKGADVYSRQRGSEHLPTRRNSGQEATLSTSSVPPHLPTPSPSVISQSSSTDGSVLSPSLLLLKSPAASVRLPADIWGTSLSSSWDKTTVGVDKISQSGSTFMSPQSVSSVQSTFEPVSPPHNFKKNDEPPPPPPPISKPPPPPVDRDTPSVPPCKKPSLQSSCMNYEDISPDPMFSPGEEDKLVSATKGKDETKPTTKFIESSKRDYKLSASPPSSKVHSPRINRNESYSKWEKKKQIEREEKHREKNRDSDRHSGVTEKDLSSKDDRRLDKYGDYRYKRDGYLDKRDYCRRDDYDRKRTGGRWDKDDYKYKKDRYSTSPRRGDECRWSDYRESQSRDPRLWDKDNESNGGKDLGVHNKNARVNERGKDGQSGDDGYSRDPRLRGKNVETCEIKAKKVKDLQDEEASPEPKNDDKSDPKVLNSDLLNAGDNNFKSQDPRLCEKDIEEKTSVYGQECINSGNKGTTEQPQRNNETKDNCRSDSAEPENETFVSSAAEIISSVVAGIIVGETVVKNRYSEDAYTVGVEACSDEEEPLPPGDERDVAHEVQLDITRSKIKAAQNAVKKRKLSETAFQEEKENNGPKSKKIQIVLKSVQLNSAEGELISSPSLGNSSKDEEPGGGWSSVPPEVAADVAVQCGGTEDSTLRSTNLPLTEDISPCNSPAVEAVSHIGCNSSTTFKEQASVDLYSDIEGNEDDQDIGDVNNEDNDDAMSLSSISSNEDTLEVNEPEGKPLPKPENISVPPPSVVFPPYPPPIFNPSIPPPPFFNPRVPPPPIVPVTVPPPPIPAHPLVPPPPTIRPSLPARPILPPAVPPPTVPPPVAQPIPVQLPSIPPPLSVSSGFYDPRVPPQFSNAGYPNSGTFGYQKLEQKKPLTAVIIDEVYRNICGELDTVLKRDIFKKLVEASAFKALESWWDNKTKPKSVSQTTANSSRNLSVCQSPASTAGLPSNLGTGTPAIGPSPFERSHSMLLGLRASLPKLPSFKVKRTLEHPKPEEVDSLSRKRSNTEYSELPERETKKQIMEETDLEMDTDLESSSGWDKRLHTNSRLEEGERSQSPWQQLDDSMDVAPRATIVRKTEADERRPSTGSSLYHKVYSSSSSESESEGSESEDDDVESEEGSDEESETESETDDETESESEEEKEQIEDELLIVNKDTKQQILKDQEMAPVLVERETVDTVKESSPEVADDSTSFRLNEDMETVNKQPESSIETTTVTEKSNFKVEQPRPVEPFHSFHIANIVPDLFKNKTVPCEGESGASETGKQNLEPSIEDKLQKTNQDSKNYESYYCTPKEINTTNGEETMEQVDTKIITGTAIVGLSDKEIESSSLEFLREEKAHTEADKDDGMHVLESKMPMLSPGKPLAVSLVELDHSYGLAAPAEREPVLESVEESEVFKSDSEEPPLPGDRQLTESPVVDILTVDSTEPRLPVPDLAPPKPQFPVRSFETDDQLVYEFHKLGIDAEDCYYMKVGFEQLQQVGSESVVDAHWSSHPPTAQVVSKLRRKQKTEHGVRVHVTGCARAEGFYRIDIKEKAKYLQAQRRQLQCQANVTAEQPQQKTDGNKAKQQSREHRATQRRLQSAVCNEEFGDLLKFNQLMVRKKQLRFAKSGIHDWGLFAMESIAADEMVTEYVGEVIRQPMADIRERRYEEMGIGSSYLFRVDQETIIDATTKGNLARFINHSCDPNCYAKIVTLENAKKIVIYSKRDIGVNEEITYDYKFPIEDEKIPCLCGVPSCRGTLN